MEGQSGSTPSSGQLSDEDLAWLTIIIVVAAALLIAVIVTARYALSHIVPGSGFGIPIFLGLAVGVAYGVLAYLALRAGATKRWRS
jgi:hypothetical protein